MTSRAVTTKDIHALFWLIYGIMVRDVPVIAANAVSVLISVAMIYLVMKY